MAADAPEIAATAGPIMSRLVRATEGAAEALQPLIAKIVQIIMRNKEALIKTGYWAYAVAVWGNDLNAAILQNKTLGIDIARYVLDGISVIPGLPSEIGTTLGVAASYMYPPSNMYGQ